MEHTLLREAQPWAHGDLGQWHGLQDGAVGKAGAQHGVVFLLKILLLLSIKRYEVTINTLEIAIDAFLVHEGFDEIDGFPVAFRRFLGVLPAKQVLQMEKTVIEYGG